MDTLCAETIDDLFFAKAAAHRARPAVRLPSRTVSFGDMAKSAERIADRLGADGARGCAALILRDRAQLLAAFFGVLRSGRAAAPLDPQWGQGEMQALLADLRHEVVLREKDGGVGVTRADGASRPAEAGDFYWGFSSGTTGRPKPFARCHRSWIESFAACEAVFPLRPDDVIAIPGSLSHSLFLFGAVQALARGLPVAAVERFHQRGALEHFTACRATVLWCVPSMLDAFAGMNFGSWRPRLIFCGGAKLPPALRAAVERALPDADLVEFYGSSELSFVTYASTSKPAPAGSVGRAFPGVRIRISAEDGEGIGPGRNGFVEVASAMVFSRYLGAGQGADRPAQAWSGAGDLGYLDEGGFLHLTGRMARVINTKSLKIAAEPIEDALNACGGVEAAAVAGVPDARRGEAIAAFIVPGAQFAGRAALLAACRSRLSARHLPKRIFLMDALPLTRSGKVAVATLKEMALRADPALRELPP